MATPKPSDSDYVKRVLNENEHGTRRWQIVKLPCGHGNVEIERPEDQWLYCSRCHRKFLLTWSPIESKRKIAENVPDFVRRFY